MKILYVDSSVGGHHFKYMNRIIQEALSLGIEVSTILPSEDDSYPFKNIYLKFPKRKNIFKFIFDINRWLKKISKLVNEEKPDIIHFLYSDSFYFFGGFGLRHISKKVKIIVLTQHHIPHGKIRSFLYRSTLRKVSKVVEHTERNCKLRQSKYDNKIEYIAYPVFHSSIISKDEARKKLNLKINSQTLLLLALGGTRYDKGLDILLDALNSVRIPFYLVIAGKEQFFKLNFIKEINMNKYPSKFFFL